MKIISLLSLAFLLGAGVNASDKAALEPIPVEDSAMSIAIKRTQFVTEHKPNPAAKYYMYLFTASWCSPCRALMPKIIEEYPKMMVGRHMEIILVSFDDTEDEALTYLRKYDAPFATVMYNVEPPHSLPGLPPDVNAIPHIIVVDSAGKFIYRGHGLRYSEWKQRTGGMTQE